jgi:hypothetical protein
MNESKIVLTERLRRENRWAEASVRKDEICKELRAKGVSRQAAREEAWQRMATEFPLLSSAPAEATAACCGQSTPDVAVPQEISEQQREREREVVIAHIDAYVEEVSDAVLSEWSKRFGLSVPHPAKRVLRDGLFQLVHCMLWHFCSERLRELLNTTLYRLYEDVPGLWRDEKDTKEVKGEAEEEKGSTPLDSSGGCLNGATGA